MRISRLLAVAALACAASVAQSPLEFEVATIKPSPPLDFGGGKIMVRMGERNDGAMVHYYRMTLRQLVQNAYRVKDYQVTGASWMDTLPFDVDAKLPEGATKDQAPDMLQNLLRERFKLTFHREKKDYPVFALVAKGGGKLKPADPNNAFPVPPGVAAPPAEGGRAPNASPEGQTRMMMSPTGGKVEARAITLGRLAEMLSNYVGRPVLDETGLDGKYDFSLDVAPEEMANSSAARGMPMMAAMAKGGDAGPAPGRGGPEAGAEPHASILQSIQSYGLKLESKKAPVDIIVIDSAEKSPAEN